MAKIRPTVEVPDGKGCGGCQYRHITSAGEPECRIYRVYVFDGKYRQCLDDTIDGERKLPIADLIMCGLEVLKIGKDISPYRETLAEVYAATKGQCPDGVDPYLWARVAGLVGGE